MAAILLARARAAYTVPTAEHIAAGLKRLEQLAPDVGVCDIQDLPALALRYVERLRDDVVQLELEWEVLEAALAEAWLRREYETVLVLVDAMARPMGRVCTLAEAERILSMGMEASRRVQDQRRYVAFMNRRGGLLYSHASYWLGRQVWSTSLQIAAASTSGSGLWQPLASFAHIVDMLGNYSYAQQFVEALIHAGHENEPDAMAVALFVRGFYARLMREMDHAHEDFCSCLHLLAAQSTTPASSPDRRFFTLVVQAELARVEDDYTRAAVYTEHALALAQLYSDRYTMAALLCDQGLYAHACGQFGDIAPMFQRLHTLAQQMHAPHVYRYCRFLGQYVLDETPPPLLALAERNEAAETYSSSSLSLLSKREQEVLRYVAAGCSNREIAAQLVVTPATVKKHLEHIFLKLEVRNRTSALARARMLKAIP